MTAPERDAEAIIGLCEETMRAMSTVGGSPEMEALAATLSLAQGRCLMNVSLHPHCSLNELSEHLGISASTASAQVEELVQLHLIERAPDEHDRRAVRISLASRGRKLFERHREQKLAHLDERLARLTKAQRGEMVEAMRVLQLLFQKMNGKEDNDIPQ